MTNDSDQTPSNTLPYRPCVGIMLANAQGQVWLGRRIPKVHDEETADRLWQMPQGGIDEGEEPDVAALRELHEETGVRNVEIIGRTQTWLRYDLPPHLVGLALKGRFRGQEQLWFAMRFTGTDSEIDLGDPQSPLAEFDAWEWVAPEKAIDLIVPFKRAVYAAAIAELMPLIEQNA